MHRFYLPPEQCQSPILTLTGHEAHHGLRVRRLRRGERVSVLDGEGREYLCETAELGRDVRLTVCETRSVPATPHRVTLVQGLLHGKLFDGIIQKATELGVHRI